MFQELTTTGQNNKVTPYTDNHEKGFEDMRVKIRTDEQCPQCQCRFAFSPMGLYCPQHPRIKAHTYYLDWFFLGERFRLYGFDSFKAAVIKAGTIDNELEAGSSTRQVIKGCGVGRRSGISSPTSMNDG